MERKNEWETITRDKLIEHCVIEGLSDSAIARMYGTTPSKVKYKRNKLRAPLKTQRLKTFYDLYAIKY